MEKTPLPLVGERTEFGFARTHCACPSCTNNCRYLPGYLVPADLGRLAPVADGLAAVLAWARRHLRASPGALVAQGGRLFRIPTLVPARRAGGTACHWLDAEDRCAVHAAAPYGCAFMDMHLDADEGRRRSAAGLRAVAQAWARAAAAPWVTGARARAPVAEPDVLYPVVWRALQDEGLLAPPPEVARDEMARGLRGRSA